MKKRFLSILAQASGVLFFVMGTIQAEAFVIPSFDSHLVTDIHHGSCLVSLEDGSQWKVSNRDQYELFSWNAQGNPLPISITPSYFSSYFSYYLTNQETGSYVRANLIGAPLRGSPYAVTIIGLDRHFYEKGFVYLSNGTFWRISSLDLELIRNWHIDDLVIIGKNTEWFSFNTHILINIHTNTFVRAHRI